MGLGNHFGDVLSNFPYEIKPAVELLAELASSGPRSAQQVLSCVENMNVYAEPLENVSTAHVQNKGQNRWSSTTHR